MSVNSNKITIYSSPQADHLVADQMTSAVAAESNVHCAPKRTTYRVKISDAKDLEALSTAAMLGLTSWVGGQKVRIVGVAGKQFSESAATSQVSVSQSFAVSSGKSVDCSSQASYAPRQAIYSQYASVKPRLHSSCSTVVSGSDLCTLSTYSDSGDSQCRRSPTPTTFQLCSSNDPSTQVYSHSQPSNSLKVGTHSAMSSRYYGSGSSHLLIKPRTQHKPTSHSSTLDGLRGAVRYLGTVAVSSHNVVAVKDSNEAAAMCAVKRLSETVNRLSNDKQLTLSTVRCVTNNHLQKAWKTNNQPLNQIQNSSLISAKPLKRPFVEDDKTGVVSVKRMAHSVLCSTGYVEGSNMSDAISCATGGQPLTSNMLNHVATSSVSVTASNCQQTMEVNNNYGSPQQLLSSLIPHIKLTSGPGMLLSVLLF